MVSAVKATHLTKTFYSKDRGRITALSALDCTLEAGEALAVIGPNGAGKTTFLRLVGGLLAPSDGSVQVLGHTISRKENAVQRRIGFLSAESGLYERLSVRESLAYFGSLHGMQKGTLGPAVDAVIKRLDLGKVADMPAGALSTGMKQRVSIARTVLHEPDLIILDEATRGLDIRMAEILLEILEALCEQGAAILYSTHHLHECERLCSRFLLLDNGCERASGDVVGDWQEKVCAAMGHAVDETD